MFEILLYIKAICDGMLTLLMCMLTLDVPFLASNLFVEFFVCSHGRHKVVRQETNSLEISKINQKRRYYKHINS